MPFISTPPVFNKWETQTNVFVLFTEESLFNGTQGNVLMKHFGPLNSRPFIPLHLITTSGSCITLGLVGILPLPGPN